MPSANIRALILLTCAVSSYAVGPYRGTCKKMAIFKIVQKDRALSGHVISSHDVTTRFQCADKCLQTSGCRSYNYQETGSPLHVCELSDHTKTSAPSEYVIKSGFTYYDAEQFVLPVCASSPCQNSGTCGFDECTDSYECLCRPGYLGQNCETWFGMNGSSSSWPGHSCLNIKRTGQDTGDGTYWIKPGDTGTPFTVYCDMTTDGGGWTLIKKYVLNTAPPSTNYFRLSSYRDISNPGRYEYVEQPALNELKQVMGFTQLRYYCRKVYVGRVVHIMTAKNDLGYDAVRYFIVSSSPYATACNSFVRLPDDQSILAANCAKWGQKGSLKSTNTWGHSGSIGKNRQYNRPIVWPSTRALSFFKDDFRCDDSKSKNHRVGDTYSMFVR